MTGGLLAVGIALWGLTGIPIYPLCGLIIGLCAIFVACYMLWRDERQKYLDRGEKASRDENEIRSLSKTDIDTKENQITDLQKRLDKFENNDRPRIVGILTNYYHVMGYLADLETKTGIRVNLGLSIINESHDTTLHGFRLTIYGDNDTPYTSNKPDLPIAVWDLKNDKLAGLDGIDAYVADSLQLNPQLSLTKGKRLAGDIWFDFPDVGINDFGTRFRAELSVEDAFGVRHKISAWSYQELRAISS